MPPAARRAPEDAPLARLVREQHAALVRSIMSVTDTGRHDAEDVLSIVTLRVLLNGVTTEPECWFGYIRDAARNEALNTRRAERRRDLRETVARLPGPDPHADAITARIVLLDVMRAVAELPEVEREIVRLRYFQERTYDEIASELRLTRSGVNNRLRQARGRLRKIMAEHESDEVYSAMLTTLAASITARIAEVARRAGTVAPSAVAVASATTLSMLAVLAVPSPRVGRAATPEVATVTTAPPVAPISPLTPVSAGSRGARSPQQAAVSPPVAPAVARPGSSLPALHLLPALLHDDACAGAVCVGNEPPGDRVRFRTLPVGTVGQTITPVCWAVPDNTEVECRSDSDPDAYAVRPPREPPRQDQDYPGGKSSPFASEYREPSRGTEQ